jgi:hypothetical protein
MDLDRLYSHLLKVRQSYLLEDVLRRRNDTDGNEKSEKQGK